MGRKGGVRWMVAVPDKGGGRGGPDEGGRGGEVKQRGGGRGWFD